MKRLIDVLKSARTYTVVVPDPTDPSAISEPQNPSTDEFYLIRKRRSTDCERVGRQTSQFRCTTFLNYINLPIS